MDQCQRRAERPQRRGVLPSAEGRDQGCSLNGGSGDITPASSDGLCPAAAQKRSGGPCPAAAEGSSSDGLCPAASAEKKRRTSKMVELHFVSGKVVQLQSGAFCGEVGKTRWRRRRKGAECSPPPETEFRLPGWAGPANVAAVKYKVACDLRLPLSAIRLIRDGRILQIDEPIENCIGSPITVAVGGALDQALSAAALDMLRALSYDVEHMVFPVGLLEFPTSHQQMFRNLDVAIVAEVVEESGPNRLIFSASVTKIAELAARVRYGMPALEYLRIDHVTCSTTSIASVVALLRKCPNLRCCELRDADFSAEELGTLKSQVKARVTI